MPRRGAFSFCASVEMDADRTEGKGSGKRSFPVEEGSEPSLRGERWKPWVSKEPRENSRGEFDSESERGEDERPAISTTHHKQTNNPSQH